MSFDTHAVRFESSIPLSTEKRWVEVATWLVVSSHILLVGFNYRVHWRVTFLLAPKRIWIAPSLAMVVPQQWRQKTKIPAESASPACNSPTTCSNRRSSSTSTSTSLPDPAASSSVPMDPVTLTVIVAFITLHVWGILCVKFHFRWLRLSRKDDFAEDSGGEAHGWRKRRCARLEWFRFSRHSARL